MHRPIEGDVKTCTLRRNASGNWLVSFSCEVKGAVTFPSVLGYWYHGDVIIGILMLILLLLFMWVLMYIGYVVACWFYNLVIPWTGGIEVEVRDIGMRPERDVQAEPPLQEDGVELEQMITPSTDKKHTL
jgi:hypothetical protein